MLPPLAVVPYDAVEEGLQEARAAWSSRAGPRSTHCGDERRSLVLSAATAVSSLHGRVKRRRRPLRFRLSVRCKGRCVYRPEQHGAGTSVTVPGNDGATRGLDLEGEDDSGGQVRVSASPAEGSGSFGAHPRPRSRPAVHWAGP